MGGTLQVQEIVDIVREFPEYLACQRFVETGTHYGMTVAQMTCLFPECHTIELSDHYYELAKKNHGHLPINFHHGDSAKVLKELGPTLTGPTVFFLDANFSGGNTAQGETDVPLLEELETIAARKETDLIVIDDVRLFGTTHAQDWGRIC